MTIELGTNLLPIVKPDTYWNGLWAEVDDDCWDDIKKTMMDKVHEYLDEALQQTDFSGAKIHMTKFGSPREYNFGTDWCDFELEVADEVVEKIKDKVDDDFFKWAYDNYHSYDGFISFAPLGKENYLEALDMPLGTFHYQKEYAISMWIMYQLKDYPDQQHDYEMDIWEQCSMNGWLIDEEEEEQC